MRRERKLRNTRRRDADFRARATLRQEASVLRIVADALASSRDKEEAAAKLQRAADVLWEAASE